MGWPVSEGLMFDDSPYLSFGAGPPLVMASGLSLQHANPTGMERRMYVSMARRFADHFTVHIVNRKRGLRPGESMSDLAGHLASAIEHDLGGPVLLHGASTGGSVALQLAIDRPDLVRRLVLLSSACRLSARRRQIQADFARRARQGDPRRAYAAMVGDIAPRGLGRPARWLLSLHAPGRPPIDPSDLLVTIAAEDSFDAEPDLPRVTAPTLVIGGDADLFYSRDLFQRTADGVADGRAVIYPGIGHLRTSSGSAQAHLALGFLLAG